MILRKFGDENHSRTYKYWCKQKADKNYQRIRLRNRIEQKDKYFRFNTPKIKGDVYQTVEYIRKHRSERKYTGSMRDCPFAYRYDRYLYYDLHDTFGDYLLDDERLSTAGGWL